MTQYGQSEIEMLKDRLRFGPVEIRLISDSMEPVLKVGSSYKLIQAPFAALKKFDVVVFWTGEVLVAHYVWHINSTVDKGTLVTRSLRPGTEDLPLQHEQIMGKVFEAQIPLWIRMKIVLSAVFRSIFFRL